MPFWLLGYPQTSLVEIDRALNAARKTGHAPTLMFALWCTAITRVCCRDYATTNAQLEACVTLADEKGAVLMKMLATGERGCLLALTGERLVFDGDSKKFSVK